MKLLKHLKRSERGSALVEQLVVLSVIGLAMATAMVGVSTGAIGLRNSRANGQAMTLAAAQMEWVKSQPFSASATSYPLGVTAPTGFTVDTVAAPVADADTNVQTITVTVARNGATLVSVEDLKVNRP